MAIRFPSSRHWAAFLPPLLLCALAAPVAGQLVPVRTLPLATGDQFLIHPAARLGMGGVGIAVADTLHDPFVNPALGARLAGAVLFGAPTLYQVSEGLGDGRTLPVGGLFAGRDWFGGLSLALQQLDAADRFRGGFGVLDVGLTTSWAGSPEPLSERSQNNLYAGGLLGRRLADGRTSVGLGVSYAALAAVDGVDLLYARSERIDQDGSRADVRLGLLREMRDASTLELLLLHHRLDMTHEVAYRSWRWDPVRRQGFSERRVEKNEDRTRTWGAHLGYVRPVGEAGVRVGGSLTANYKTHPKIPNYEIMNIPRDPGTTWAYEAGVGIARSAGPATLALDVVYQPIWSETWAEADTVLRLPGGRTIQVGERTVENEFRFHNALVRLGVERAQERYGFQLGLEARAINYRLEQDDHALPRQRTQREDWVEWTPSWGVGLFFPELQLRYSGRLTTGTGRPGVELPWGGNIRAGAVNFAAADFVVAPSGPLTLQEASVVTHQVMVSVPIR